MQTQLFVTTTIQEKNKYTPLEHSAMMVSTILLLSLYLIANTVADNHENCQYWAEEGECDKNPTYMLENCKESCRKVSTVSDERCQLWAEGGDCDKNPTYMLENCKESCRKVAIASLRAAKELASIESFFDLSAKDIHGDIIEFSRFRGQVTILTNVASYCGYTDSHYKGVSNFYVSF